MLNHLIRSQVLARLRQRLPYSSWQLVPYETRKHHNILRGLHTTLNRVVQLVRVIAQRPQLLRLVTAANDRPDHDVADGTCNGDGVLLEDLRFVTDG